MGAGNVTKVKQLRETATPAVRDDLRRGEVKIHRAWKWRLLPPNLQNEELNKYRHGKDIRHAIRQINRHLLRKHRARQDNVLSLEQFAARLTHPARGELANVMLLVAELPGPAIVVTRDLYNHLLGKTRP